MIMNMFSHFVFVGLLGLVSSDNTCTSCKTAAAQMDTESDPTTKCSLFKAYMTCLDNTTKNADGCPLEDADADMIKSFDDTTNCKDDDALNDVCNCQKKFWGKADACTAISSLEGCIKGKEDQTGCGTVKGSDVLSKAKARCLATTAAPDRKCTKATEATDCTETETCDETLKKCVAKAKPTQAVDRKCTKASETTDCTETEKCDETTKTCVAKGTTAPAPSAKTDKTTNTAAPETSTSQGVGVVSDFMGLITSLIFSSLLLINV